MTETAMNNKTPKWPNPKSFFLIWFAMVLLTWVLVCLLALTFMYPILEAGLVPYPILFVLALLPIFAVTLFVFGILIIVARRCWPDSPEFGKKLVLLGTPLLTWLVLFILTWLLGGADAFVPRL